MNDFTYDFKTTQWRIFWLRENVHNSSVEKKIVYANYQMILSLKLHSELIIGIAILHFI